MSISLDEITFKIIYFGHEDLMKKLQKPLTIFNKKQFLMTSRFDELQEWLHQYEVTVLVFDTQDIFSQEILLRVRNILQNKKISLLLITWETSHFHILQEVFKDHLIDEIFFPTQMNFFENKLNVLQEIYKIRKKIFRNKMEMTKILNYLHDCVIIINEHGMVIEANQMAITFFKKLNISVIGSSLDKMFYVKSPEGLKAVSVIDLVTFKYHAVNTASQFNLAFIENMEQYKIPVDYTCVPIFIHQCRGRFAVIFQDLSSHRYLKHDLDYIMHIDLFTGLPNRYAFKEYLPEAIARAERCKKSVAIFMLNLDHFKSINDTFGAEYGNCMLKQVADRLLQSTRENDFVGKLSGDEFVIVLDDIDNSDNAEIVAKNIINQMQLPFLVNTKDIKINCSIGIALYPNDCFNLDELLKSADSALREAKRKGKNQYCFFEKTFHDREVMRVLMIRKLRIAMMRGSFFLHFQPQINLRKKKITGVEALIRWVDEDNKMILPNVFLPVAEQFGLINPIGRWVLKNAFEQAKIWQDTKELVEPLIVAVNISVRQLQDKSFVDNLNQTLNYTQVDPSFIELEITEDVIIEDPDRMIKILDNLKKLGVKISLDDFGTGYSSLNYIRQLPIDTLKLDQSFVQNIGVCDKDEQMIKSIIELSHVLDIKVVAEGVETKAQLDFLVFNGCDVVQGYYFGRPVSVKEINHILLGKHKDFPYQLIEKID